MKSTGQGVARFSGRVEDYVRYRPGYPNGLFDSIQVSCGLKAEAVIADVGCGPGTSSVPWLERGYQVIGVEPNLEMRLAAEKELARFHRFSIIDGSSDWTTLPDHSVDLVFAAQAFHWFDASSARLEFGRILRRPAWVALVWNTLRMDTPFLQDYESLLQRFGTDYRQVHHKLLDDTVFSSFFAHGHERRLFANSQSFDFEGSAGRLRSSSFVPLSEDSQFAPMMAELHKIFNQHQFDGRVQFVYDTELFLGVAD